MNRKLARIVKIDDIKPIENADAIELAIIGGWQVVVKKNQFNVNDLACYAEIDSWIPETLAPFLIKSAIAREYNGIKGERLRTIRLRGELSQGLILPLFGKDGIIDKFASWENVDNRFYPVWIENVTGHGYHIMPDSGWIDDIFDIDLTEVLGIQKWEKPISAQLSGMVKGNFPTRFCKTDLERLQNCKKLFQESFDNDILFEVSIKMDGSSFGCGNLISEEGIDVHVCSRNMSLKLEQEGNSFVDMAKSLNLIEKLSNLTTRQIQFSGELMGPGIQGNREKLAKHKLFIFNVFDVDKQQYVSAKERKELVEQFGLQQVPILHESITLRELGLDTIEKVLAFAEGPSLNAKLREGLVFKAVDGSFSFKAIANSYLLKYNDD